MKQLVAHVEGKVSIKVVMGGLRAGNRQPMDDPLREYVLGHWHKVHQASGQPFRFDFAMPTGFIYNTEPACRAVITADHLAPSSSSRDAFQMMESIQQRFYRHNEDVTQVSVLIDCARACGFEPDLFAQTFQSGEMCRVAQEHFSLAKSLTQTGFPTLLGHHQGEMTVLAPGFMAVDRLLTGVDGWWDRCHLRDRS